MVSRGLGIYSDIIVMLSMLIAASLGFHVKTQGAASLFTNHAKKHIVRTTNIVLYHQVVK